MPGPPGELMTSEKIISRERYQKSPTHENVAKLFLESKFQRKGNKQTIKRKFSANLVVFSAATHSETIIIQILHGIGKKKF